MDGRWIGGPPGGAPRVSLQAKQQVPPQPPKDRESTRDNKSFTASAGPSSTYSTKGGPQGGPLGATRGAQGTKKAAASAPTPAEPAAAALRGKVTSGSATSSSSSSSAGGTTANTASTSSRIPLVQQLPVQTEEEFLKGCGFQAIWSENFEVSGLMNAAVKMCKLAPTEGDEEWQEAHLSFLQLLSLCRARLGRHQCLLQSRLQDVEDVLQMEEEIQARIEQYKCGIATARTELEVAALMRKRRKELDAICAEVLKKPCLQETTCLEREEAVLRMKAENTTKDITTQIATKKRQVDAAIKAAEDLFANPSLDPVAT